MDWKKLDDKGKEYICWNSSNSVEVLEKFAEKYNIVEYSEVDESVPLVWLLTKGTSRVLYINPQNGEKFYKTYGFDNPYSKYYTELFDHKMAFRDVEGKVYLVSHPYDERMGMSEEEALENKMSIFREVLNNVTEYGDLSSVNLEILPKEESYYYPNNTRCFVYSIK